MQHQRRFQQETNDTVLRKAEAAKLAGQYPFKVVLVAAPGSGKTMAVLQAADSLFKRGDIDAVVILVPRLNLAIQIELSWRKNRSHFEPEAMGAVSHRENQNLRIRKNEAGYVTTYSSLVADPERHHHELRDKQRVLLILDEAHQLGVEGDEAGGQASTCSAEEVQHFVQAVNVVGILVMSGTPFRSDGSRLLFAEYETREDGYDYLKADVIATYSDGIEGGYLRQFQAFLIDGEIDLLTADKQIETYTLSEYEYALRRFLVDAPGYWQALVEEFVRHLAQQHQVDRRFRGLVACYNQEQANQVVSYLKKSHPHLRILKAISEDGTEAQQNLRRFREEPHDVLVTVQMAYVGYDQPWISVVLPLTGIRGTGYLRQLLARSLRVVEDVPYHKQPAIWVLPADPRMKEFIETERQELELGLAKRKTLIETVMDGAAEGLVLATTEHGWVLEGRVTDQTAMGFNREGDANGQEIRVLEALIAELHLDVTVSGAKALVARVDQLKQQSLFGDAVGHYRTQRELEKAALERLTNTISEAVHQLPFFRQHCKSDSDWARAHTAIRTFLKSYLGKPVSQLDMTEIQEEISLVASWLIDKRLPEGVAAAFRQVS